MQNYTASTSTNQLLPAHTIQRIIIEIVGAPGTGKTFFLHQFAAQHPGKRIVACSLTTTAGHALQLGLNLPDDQVGTLHSLAYRALGRPPLTESALKEWNKTHPRWRITHQHHLDRPSHLMGEEKIPPGDRLAMHLAQLRTRQTPTQQWPGDVQQFAKAWDKWKQDRDLIDFADLLELARTETDTAPGNPEIFLLDEAQDFGALDLALIEHWTTRVAILAYAHDPHQSLYTFRGGGAPFPWTPTERIVLAHSYRLPRTVHARAIPWMRRTGPTPVQYAPRNAEGHIRGGTSKLKGDPYFTAHLSHDLRPHLEAGRTVMLLTTCGYMLYPILKALQTLGIVYHNPYRPQEYAWNPLGSGSTETGGTPVRSAIIAFARTNQHIWQDQAEFWNWREVQLWASRLVGMRSLITRAGEKALKNTSNVEDITIARNMRHWFTPEALDRILNIDIRWYLAQLRLSKAAHTLITHSLHHRDGDLGTPFTRLHETPQVIVGTVHSVKGGEANVVAIWPDISKNMYDKRAEKETFYGMNRTAYVGLTRAKDELILMPAFSRKTLW